MDAPEAAEPWAEVPPSLIAPAVPVPVMPWSTVAEVVWAAVASTSHRIRRGEGALLAVNLSLLAPQGRSGLAGAAVSVLAIGAMYAFNDLYDAPTDANNPKKDRALIATYLAHRRLCTAAVLALKLATLALACAALGGRASAAVAGALLVNLVYSTLLKGVPVVDVVWCGVWGALYAAIVTASAPLLVLVGLMTAVCHLYQALDDRAADAANAIVTTAVRSPALSRNVLAVLSLLLFVALRPPLGTSWALTAFTPLGIYFAAPSFRTGWLLTKIHFGVVWLGVLELARATG
jgi:4-hydroxybenzoate polyprenyltransferase